MNTPKEILQPLVERLRDMCNRDRCGGGGQCFSSICLRRGGWKKGDPVDYSLATCEHHEQVQALAELLARVTLMEDAITAMVEDGWLYYGEEGMDPAQEKCYAAYLTIHPSEKQK